MAGSRVWVAAVAAVLVRRVADPRGLVAEMRAVPGANASAAKTLEMLAVAVAEKTAIR